MYNITSLSDLSPGTELEYWGSRVLDQYYSAAIHHEGRDVLLVADLLSCMLTELKTGPVSNLFLSSHTKNISWQPKYDGLKQARLRHLGECLTLVINAWIEYPNEPREELREQDVAGGRRLPFGVHKADEDEC